MSRLAAIAESGWVPDVLLRHGIRRQLRERLRDADPGTPARRDEAKRRLVETLRSSPVALEVQRANEQHYEVPTAFFELILGPRLKYSSAYWPDGVGDLAAAEQAMLKLTCARAGIADGMDVLELGCGWGALSLWIAERFPRCRVLAVSNSPGQVEHVGRNARERGLDNVEARRADMNGFDTGRRFDRVVSIEMFEHMRNYETLMARIASWLRPEGRLFVHLFCHRELAYPYETDGRNDWMARYFFTGGLMPSADLLLHFQRDLVLDERWRIDGTHYRRTLEAWLARLDARRDAVLELFRSTYGTTEARRWLVRWRLFLLACSELFGYRGGEEWWVAHYRFRPRAEAERGCT